jgi:RNA polymerase sigma-70 factor (family 1)
VCVAILTFFGEIDLIFQFISPHNRPLHNCDLHNEKDLLYLVSLGDEMAFTQIFNAYSNKIGSYVFRFTESFSVTQEIVQDVFLKIWTNRSSLLQVQQFDAYLHVVARNHTFNCLKKMARESAKKQAWDNSLSITASDDALIMSLENRDNHLWGLLDNAIAGLSPQQQKVYILSRREGLKHEEIAARLNISLETVKKHMVLALRAIKMNITGNDNIDPLAAK